jgi:hypothetical protein
MIEDLGTFRGSNVGKFRAQKLMIDWRELELLK